MRFFRRALVGLVLAALTAGLLALAGLTLRQAVQDRLAASRTPPPARERVFAANVMTAEVAEVTPQMTVYGEVRSRRTLELRSPRAGTVVELAPGFEDGAQVAAGQVLWRLDPADATAQRDLARTDLARAEAEERDALRALALARDDLAAAEGQAALRAQAMARQQDLRTRGVGSDAAVETAALAQSTADQAVLSRRAALAQAEARRDQAEVALGRQRILLAEVERALAETVVRAEFDGILNGASLVRGRILSGNERVADLIDPTALEVAVRLSTAQYGRLLDGSGLLMPLPVTVTLDVAGAEIAAQGRLARASAAVGEGQTGRLVFAALDSGAAGFRPGDFVTLRIAEPPLPAAVVLPATALGADGAVLALGPEDRLQALPVTLIRRQGDSVILAAEGLAGREVVTERSALLGAGIRVRPMRSDAAPEAEQAAAEFVTLTPERRAALVAQVEGNTRMPAEVRARILAQLAEDRVPAQVIARLEARGGG